MHFTGKDYKRIYTKSISITQENLNWIKQNKGKKSAAGYLDKIINEYKKYVSKQ